MEDKEKKAKAKPVAKSAAVKQSAEKTATASPKAPAKAAATPKAKKPSEAVAPAAAKSSVKKSAAVAVEKPAAKSKKAAEVAAPATGKPVAKKSTAVAAEKPAAKSKAAAIVAAPATAKPSAKKSTAATAEKPAAKSKKAAEVEAPASEKPAAKKSAAVAAEKPATKSKNAAEVAAPATEKPAAKKSAAVAAEKPAAKSKKAAEVAAPATEKPSTRKSAAAEKPSEAKAAKTPKAKSKKEAATEAPAAEIAAQPSKKVRLKPRRRELKRQGLWVPKHQRGKQASAADDLDVHQGSKSALSGKGKGKSEVAPPQKPGSKRQDAPIEAPAGKKFGKEEKRGKEGKGDAPKKSHKPKLMPEAFTEFVKPINSRLERKNERKQERLEKAERDYDQSQGLFTEPIRLNRFVSLSGICSRREADVLIQDGKVKVNGKVVREMGHKIMPGKDKVTYKDNELRIKVFVYLLMNKPKNRLSTTDDERGRDTVMEIAERYTKARVYPVGRLDRNTTGLLLLTNDGDLTLKLTHPSCKFPKLYNARLDKDITDADILALRKGFELEDGFIKADKADRTSIEVGNEIGIEINSGANHIVKRMLAHLGYEVISLDRVKLGPLDKKGLPRGTCRLLKEKEVGFLKML